MPVLSKAFTILMSPDLTAPGRNFLATALIAGRLLDARVVSRPRQLTRCNNWKADGASRSVIRLLEAKYTIESNISESFTLGRALASDSSAFVSCRRIRVFADVNEAKLSSTMSSFWNPAIHVFHWSASDIAALSARTLAYCRTNPYESTRPWRLGCSYRRTCASNADAVVKGACANRWSEQDSNANVFVLPRVFRCSNNCRQGRLLI
jgi:hypothetical protein